VRFLIVSDIHANWEALEAVIQATAGTYDAIAAGGDFVGYGADANLVVDWARECTNPAIRGNHDKAAAGLIDLEWFNLPAQISARWTHDELTPENLEWIRRLPQGPAETPHFDIIHGSPVDEDEYLITREEIASVAAALRKKLTFFGHTHLQGAYLCHRNGVMDLGAVRKAEETRTIELEPDSFYMINPGSVGQPRDGDPRAAYAVYEPEQLLVTLHRVPYDIEQAQAKIRKSGLPDVLADRLSFGR
jgi:diadenosine tetraphosphatase ApaH/serine/threonine PP2A family protein phosphatase